MFKKLQCKKNIFQKITNKIKHTHKKKQNTKPKRVLLAKCYLYVTDCIVAEAEKMGRKYKSMLRSIRDPRIKRLRCQHKGL